MESMAAKADYLVGVAAGSIQVWGGCSDELWAGIGKELLICRVNAAHHPPHLLIISAHYPENEPFQITSST